MSNLEAAGRARPRTATRQRCQQGISLVELLVGIAVGLMVITAALGSLLLSRGASTAVSEISQLQQQGSYALRTIGVQLRQAGSVEVAKATTGLYAFNNEFLGFNGGSTVVVGTDGAGGATDSVSVSNQPSTELTTQQVDCVGTKIKTGVRMDSTFYVQDGQLYCKGANAATQPVIGNVSDFQLTYRVKSGAGTQAMTGAAVAAAGLWASVKAVEICLDLQGDDPSNPTGTYQSCQPAAGGGYASTSRNGRIHVVFRNVFDLRTQGL